MGSTNLPGTANQMSKYFETMVNYPDSFLRRKFGGCIKAAQASTLPKVVYSLIIWRQQAPTDGGQK